MPAGSWSTSLEGAEDVEAPLLDAQAVDRVRALGFAAVQCPAGVRFERRDNEPSAVAPEVLDALFRCLP